MINSVLPIPKPRMSSEVDDQIKEAQSEIPPKKAAIHGEAMKCFCRIRPSDLKNGKNLIKKEIFKIIENSDDKNLSVKMDANILQKCGGVSSFTFSKIFNESSTQIEVFESTSNILIEEMFKNKKGGLIFTYGMTNAGKTFTVVGKPDNPGILPLSLKCIYETILNMEFKPKVSCNFMEIYNEEMFDLLSHDPKNPKYKKKVYIKEREKRFVIQDITNIKIENLDDFSDALNRGISKKAHSSTNLNQNSSRSHTIFKIIVSFPTQIKKNEIEYQEISLSIVDLAGSERQNRTEAQGKELQEACKINQSLSVLGKCMEALRHNSIYQNKKIVPYRESKLTMLFQEYFQGDQNIIMVTNINPRREDFEETMRALTYSCIAKEIKPIKSKIINFNKKREIIKVEEDESLTEEKNVCKNLNEIFSENKNNVVENNFNHLSFSEGRSSFCIKDEIDFIKADLDLYKKKYDESQNIIIEYEKKIDIIITKYEEIKSELANREQYGRVEAIKEIITGLNSRPRLYSSMFQIFNEKEEEKNNNYYSDNFSGINMNKFLPMNNNQDQNKINIIMIQPNFNEIKFSSDLQQSISETFAVESKKETSTVQINITNSNNQVNENKHNETKEENSINDKKKHNKTKRNNNKKNKKKEKDSFGDSCSNIDTTDLTLQKDSINESLFSEISVDNKKVKKKTNHKKNNNKKKVIRKESISPIKEQLENSAIYGNELSPNEKEISLEQFEKNISEDEDSLSNNKKGNGKVLNRSKFITNNSDQEEEEEPIKKKNTRSKNKRANFKKYYR